MFKIRVRNSSIIIDNYEQGDCPELEKNFMVYNLTTHRYDILGMYFDKKNKKLYIPRGIDIWYIKKVLGVSEYYVEPPNEFDRINDILVKVKPRDDQQVEALKFMCGVGQEYEQNYQLPQLSVNLTTGKGKTYCSISTVAFMKIKSIIITASTTLLNQWMNNIKEYTNLEDSNMLFISGSSMLNMIYNSKSTKAKKAKIYLVTHSTIQSYCERYGWDKLNEIFINLGIGMKFIDEAHQNFNNMLMIDFFTNVFKTYYITATPARSDQKENRIYQLTIKNVPGIDLFDVNVDPHTDYIAIKWNSKPTPVQISRCKNKYGLDRNNYVNYVVRQPNFYKLLYIIMDMVIGCGGRVLFFIGTNEAIIEVYKWIGEHYPEFLGDIGIYTSLLSREEKIREREKKLILTTTKSAGAGEDIKNLKMVILLAEPFKSEVLARQTLGRLRNDGTTYIELVDLGFHYIRRFYYAKLPIYNKYALSTSDTTIDQYELDRRSEKLIEKREKKLEMSPLKFHDERFFKYD